MRNDINSAETITVVAGTGYKPYYGMFVNIEKFSTAYINGNNTRAYYIKSDGTSTLYSGIGPVTNNIAGYSYALVGSTAVIDSQHTITFN